MCIGERQQRASAAQPNLKARCPEASEEAVTRQWRRTRFQCERQPPSDHIGRRWIEEHGDHFARRSGAEIRERRHDHANDVISRQQLYKRSNQEWIGRRVAQRGANPHEISGTKFDDH